MRTRYRIIEEVGSYFITSTAVEWLPVFTSKPYFEILMESFSFCRMHKSMKLYNPVKRGLVGMPEHWLYSSAKSFLSDSSGIEIDKLPA